MGGGPKTRDFLMEAGKAVVTRQEPRIPAALIKELFTHVEVPLLEELPRLGGRPLRK